MRRLFKSKSSADISTPTPRAKVVKQFSSRRDLRTLGATSSAVALSLGSAYYDVYDSSGDGPNVQDRDTGWQIAYGVARMAVEIAKESSDMLPPLKAVVSALSILITNYDQMSDNVEGVKEIERRVQSLSDVLSSPVSDDDHAEKGRRVELWRKLEGVIAKLEPISHQNPAVGFFRNVDNAKTLTGFVQELANTITDYQASVQQGTYERTGDICNDTKNILGDTENLLGDTENLLGDTEKLLGDTKDILGDTRDILDNTKVILEAADLEILAKLEPVRDAGYQAGHHEKCLPRTRQSVLRTIVLWARNPQDQNVFWLNGLAGTGKSTIAQSFSDMLANKGFLGASFFCSRDYLDRRELKNILPTLAYQLACHYPHFRGHIVSIIKKDPNLAHASLISQLENLLINPLSKAKVSCVIVIDALDECIDDQPASAILSVLGRFAKQLPLVKFFITGRPEPRIRTGFRLPLLEPLTQVFLLHGVESSSVDNDIRLYLTQRLTTISKQRSDLDLPDPWPCKGEVEALTKKSSGLFIFASTLVRFIESEHHEPNERLQLVLSEASGTTYEGGAGIDSLYTQVLLHAFSGVHESEVFVNLRRVLGAIVLSFNPLSQSALSAILGSSTTLISATLRHLHSVILVPPSKHMEIRIFHKSFPDFLQDEKRCTDPRFHIDPVTYHEVMALGCLELVKELKRNPCSLPPFVMNQDTPNLPQLLEGKLGGAMRYACNYWARHLRLSPTFSNYISQITILATRVLESAPPWIEVMSLENHLEEVIHSMYGLLDWLDEVIPVAQCKVKDTKQEVYPAQHKVHTAQENVRTAQNEVYAAQNRVRTAPDKLRAAQDEVRTALDEVHTAQNKVRNAQNKVRTTWKNVYTAQKGVHNVQNEVSIAEGRLGTAQKRVHAAQEELKTAQPKLDDAQRELDTAQPELYAAKRELDAIQPKLDAIVTWCKAITILRDLVLDCLRLSMHFFHPIQQCAQQVYHSALPLSPTSSHLHKSYLQSITDDQLSYVTAFVGASDTWGLNLRTINVRPRQLTCIATSLQRIIIACENIVNIYDAVTFVLQQSLSAPERVTKIQNSPDGSILFFAHSFSLTMWDVQTGGLVHTFTTQSKINDIAVSMMGGGIACGLSNGTVMFWDIHTRGEGRGFGGSQPVIAICWLSPVKLVVAAQCSVYVHDIATGETSRSLPALGPVWGMVYSLSRCEVLIGTLQPGRGTDQEQCTLEPLEWTQGHLLRHPGRKIQAPGSPERLMCPVLVGKEMVCITPPSGVQLFNTESYNWTTNPSLLDMAVSVAVSLNRNLVVQTKDSIQIFPIDVLASGKTHNNINLSHIYPLGKTHIICILQPNRNLTLLELETLQELHPGEDTLPPRSSLINHLSYTCGPVAELGVSTVTQAWQSGTPIPEWTGAANMSVSLSRLSPDCTWVVIVYQSPQQEICVKDVKDGGILANLPLEDLGTGEVYDLTFNSEARFYLNIDGPGQHVQIPCDIIASPSGNYSHTITKGEPVPLSEPWTAPPYSLDANCEWVLDAQSRKVCWISPGNVQRGDGGHFWVDLSLVMLGDDGVVRKLSFKEPDC